MIFDTILDDAADRLMASVNRYGDIVTLGDREYRWRNGDTFVRNSDGVLKPIEWHKVPQQVRDAFTECLT